MDKNKLSISFHNVDSSDSLKELIKEKVDLLLDHHGDYITKIDFVCSMENPHESTNPPLFKSSMNIHGKMKRNFNFKNCNEDPRKTVIKVANKALNSLREKY